MDRNPLNRTLNRLDIERTTNEVQPITKIYTYRNTNISDTLLATSVESNTILSNIEQTRTLFFCSSIGDRTRTPYFWLRTYEHRT